MKGDLMKTDCSKKSFQFQPLDSRKVLGAFDGGHISSDGGALLLRAVEDRTNIIGLFADCFTDHRDPDRIEHTVPQLAGQRIYGLALGYEDIIDHDDLRYDPLLAVLAGKADPTGADRLRESDRGKALAGKSTLNRLELTLPDADKNSRYNKIVLNQALVDQYFVNIFLQSRKKPPKRIVLDLDATDDLIHGALEGRFYHGYYKNYCYLPLYIFCEDDLLCARLRPSNIDAAKGAVDELKRIVDQIRQQWKKIKIVVRADGGFCREEIMSWCEQNKVKYILGLPKNSRLKDDISDELAQAKKLFEQTGEPARVYKDFKYKTLDSWSRSRRVVAKAEHLEKGQNPRFIVTSIPADEINAKTLYEKQYCARGEMENRIKEQQLHLFADRTSCTKMRANQIRLWFSSVAYTLMQALRRLGLSGTKMARAQCATIRLKLLKIGACIKISVRRIFISLASGCPYKEIFATVWANLQRINTVRY